MTSRKLLDDVKTWSFWFWLPVHVRICERRSAWHQLLELQKSCSWFEVASCTHSSQPRKAKTCNSLKQLLVFQLAESCPTWWWRCHKSGSHASWRPQTAPFWRLKISPSYLHLSEATHLLRLGCCKRNGGCGQKKRTKRAFVWHVAKDGWWDSGLNAM